MPNSCSVPYCKSNYKKNAPHISVFKFPTDEDLKRKWITAIKRQDFKPTKNSRVCEIHLNETDIIKEARGFDEKHGIVITAPLKIKKLKKDAVPSSFPGCPLHMNNKSNRRESPTKKKEDREHVAMSKALAESQRENEKYQELYTFQSSEELYSKFDRLDLSDHSTVVRKGDYALFLNIIPTPSPQIRYSVTLSGTFEIVVEKLEENGCWTQKFFVPDHFIVYSLLCILRAYMKLPVNQTAYLFLKNKPNPLMMTQRLNHLYRLHKESNGLLRLVYTSQTTFGTIKEADADIELPKCKRSKYEMLPELPPSPIPTTRVVVYPLDPEYSWFFDPVPNVVNIADGCLSCLTVPGHDTVGTGVSVAVSFNNNSTGVAFRLWYPEGLHYKIKVLPSYLLDSHSPSRNEWIPDNLAYGDYLDYRMMLNRRPTGINIHLKRLGKGRVDVKIIVF